MEHTVPRFVEGLQTLGVFISKREVMRLLNEGQESFLSEAN
jgi:hypothetical protein